MKKKYNSDNVVRFFIVVIGLLAIGFILKELQHIFLPFVIAYFLFFLFQPLNHLFRKIKFPGFVIIIINLTIVGFITFGIAQFLVESFSQFSKDIDSYFGKLNTIVRNAAVAIGIRDPYFKYFSIQKVLTKLDYKELAGGVFSSAFDLLGSVFLVLFFYIFIFSGHNGIFDAIRRRYVHGKQSQLEKKLLKTGKTNFEESISDEESTSKMTEKQLTSTFKAITEQIQKYIIVKIANNLAAGILVGFSLYIWGVDFPLIWGAFTFFLNFIPTIGSAVALIFPMLMALVQYGEIGIALLVALTIAAIQTIFFNLLEPLLVGKKLDLNPIVILLCVLVWGYIWGIAGMFLAVPLTAIIKIILSNSDSENMMFLSDLIDEH